MNVIMRCRTLAAFFNSTPLRFVAACSLRRTLAASSTQLRFARCVARSQRFQLNCFALPWPALHVRSVYSAIAKRLLSLPWGSWRCTFAAFSTQLRFARCTLAAFSTQLLCVAVAGAARSQRLFRYR